MIVGFLDVGEVRWRVRFRPSPNANLDVAEVFLVELLTQPILHATNPVSRADTDTTFGKGSARPWNQG